MADQHKKDENRAFYNQLYVSIAAGIGGASMMFAMNFPTFGISSMERDPNFDITEDQAMMIGSLVPAMAIVGNIGAGLLVDSVGRKKTMLVGGCFMIASYALLALATNITNAMAARALCGFGGSFVTVGGFIYMTEVLHPSLRDRLGSVTGVLLNLGMLVSFVSGSFLEWRGMAWVGLVAVLPLMAASVGLPQSPSYLIKQGKNQEALSALKFYRSSSAEASKELKELTDAIRSVGQSTASITEIFSSPNLKPLIVTIMLLLAQQTSGITGLTMYSVNIFEYLGTSVDPAYCTILIAVVNIFTTLIAAEIHSRSNRKPTLLVSAMVVCVLEILLGLFFWARASGGALKEWTDGNSMVALVLILLFYIAFGIGLGPMSFMYMGEGLPGKIRGPGAAIIVTFNMLILFVVLQTFNPIVSAVGYHYSFIAFGIVTGLLVIVTHHMMVETKGKSLSEMDQYYNSLAAKKKRT